MKKVIQYSSLKLIIFLVFFAFITSCKSTSADHLNNYKTRSLELPSGAIIKTYIADSTLEQMRGLSGIKPEDFNSKEGMFFPGKKPKARQFWMPETFFNLDIIFLSEDLYVLDIHRNLSKFIHAYPKHKVPISKEVLCTHVLEILSGSQIAKEIQPGMILKWQIKNR